MVGEMGTKFRFYASDGSAFHKAYSGQPRCCQCRSDWAWTQVSEPLTVSLRTPLGQMMRLMAWRIKKCWSGSDWAVCVRGGLGDSGWRLVLLLIIPEPE